MTKTVQASRQITYPGAFNKTIKVTIQIRRGYWRFRTDYGPESCSAWDGWSSWMWTATTKTKGLREMARKKAVEMAENVATNKPLWS